MTSRLLTAGVLACLLALALSSVAIAHADLLESDPADGETIQTPVMLTATFNEELDPEASSLIVRNAAGEEVARGATDETDSATMVAELPDLPPGDYSARWTAVTPDDQGVTRGTITFTVAPSPSPSPPPTPTVSLTPAPTDMATASPTVIPSPSPSPTPISDEPTAGRTDILIALVLAGVMIGGVAIYFLRRR